MADVPDIELVAGYHVYRAAFRYDSHHLDSDAADLDDACAAWLRARGRDVINGPYLAAHAAITGTSDGAERDHEVTHDDVDRLHEILAIERRKRDNAAAIQRMRRELHPPFLQAGSTICVCGERASHPVHLPDHLTDP